MDDKVQKRREKLAEWKAKRSQQTKDSKDQPGAGLGASTTNTPTIAKTAKPAQKKYRFAIAQLAQRPLGDTRLALGESDNDEPAMNGKQFSDDKPTAGTFKQKQVDTEMEYKVASDDDPLDAFMDHVESQVRDLAAATLDLAQADAAKLNLLLNEDDQDEEIATEREDSPPPMANPYDDDFNASEKRNRLLETDHSKIDYEPFRKDFYVEPPDLAEMTPMQVNQRRLDLDGIKVRGVRCPKPIERWSQFGMPPGVHQVIKKVLKYDRPSSIQAQAIPAIMSGRDVIGIARTGSGKVFIFKPDYCVSLANV